MKLDSFEEVLSDFRSGKAIVLIDDIDRENEGDITIASELITSEHISFMMNYSKGLICISMEQKDLNRLSIPIQVSNNLSSFGTNFTASVDHYSLGNLGVSANGRALTIKRLVSPEASPEEFSSPGWIFPLSAAPGGVFERAGQTEGSLDLARLAGLKPSGVICEIMNEDGEMLRGEALLDFCRKHGLKITSVAEIKKQRLLKERVLRRVAETEISDFQTLGLFSKENNFPLDKLSDSLKEPLKVLVYQDDVNNSEQLVIVKGDIKDSCLLRIHSECLTGDIFDSARCDCGEQLSMALSSIIDEGEGIVIYLQQEGRGIGLANKLKAYALQETGLDTVDANLELGFEADLRNYDIVANILRDLGISKVKIMTNNPAKVEGLKQGGIEVEERLPINSPETEHNREYLQAKKKKLGHFQAS